MAEKSSTVTVSVASTDSGYSIDSDEIENKLPKDHLLWSVGNVLCCWLGGIGFICSFPALILSCKIAEELETNAFDPESLKKWSKWSKWLNIIASSIYLIILVIIAAIFSFFIYQFMRIFKFQDSKAYKKKKMSLIFHEHFIKKIRKTGNNLP